MQKRDKRKEEEKKKKDWISQERQKTLQRLKSFKEKCPAQVVLKTSRSQPHNPRQPQGISRRTPAPSSQPASIARPPARQSRNAQLTQAKGPRASHQKARADIPVHIFAPAGEPKPQNQSEEAAVPPPPPPPLPPPPPPLPPPPSIKPMHLKTPRDTSDKALPLLSEGSATGSAATQRLAEAPVRSVNNCT
uniref:Uncharacterized protein n=1 Tax=Sphenodon punctatus TaxID=8508 RepID=A0A8D0L7P8_SPHPU